MRSESRDDRPPRRSAGAPARKRVWGAGGAQLAPCWPSPAAVSYSPARPPGGARISAARPTPLAGNRAFAHPPRGGREGTRRVELLLLLLEERL